MTKLSTYDEVNAAWLPALPLPPITTAEAKRIGKKLANKYCGGKMAWWMRNRKSWANTKPVTIALRQNGLQRMVHDMSHHAHEVRHAGKLKSHSGVHAALELEMIRHVIAKGLHVPKAKPKASLVEKRQAALVAKAALLKKWETKAKIANNKARKYRTAVKRAEAALLLAGGGE